LDVPDAGQVRVMGYDVVSQAAEVRRSLGWMPDAFGKYKNLDVMEYLDFFARAYGLKGALRRQRLKEVSEFTELDQIARSPVFTLSKGQSQRLSLARTLLNDPAVLILDEPAAGLDPKARVELKRLVRLLASMGKTLFISSHILSELDEVCDSLLFIENGKILFQGKSDDLKGHSEERLLLEIETEGDPAALLAWLHSSPAVQVDRESGKTCFVSIDATTTSRKELLRDLIKDDLPIVGFRKTER
jgi:ABC-2 type transport system ATP-binding protein